MIRFATFILTALAFGAVIAVAQYTGPSEGQANEPTRTVADVLKDPRDGQPVRLTGVLAKKTGKERYLFRDETGEIRVEIDTEDFPAVPVNETTRVQLIGEVEKPLLRAPEIEVKRVMVLGEVPR